MRLELIAGACKTASAGCATGDAARNVSELVREAGVPLLDGMRGHAGMAAFVDLGFEIVTFSEARPTRAVESGPKGALP